MLDNTEYISGSLFEDNYLIRTIGALATKPDIALTELVANAWDAGAVHVAITIPDSDGKKLIIEDDGTGMTTQDFKTRWMKLRYDRLSHQGKTVEFPEGVSGNRLSYGRNGMGRHGLLCFNNHYSVITKKGGIESTFQISTFNENIPFVVKDESFKKVEGHGTRLEVDVIYKLPDPERMLEIISARFLHDPNFIIAINGKSIPVESHVGRISEKEIKVSEKISLKILFIDTQKAAKKSRYQGIAFWQGGRLVGEPSWILGQTAVLDGRTKKAKRYTFVVQTEDIADYIKEDWTEFIRSEIMDDVYSAVIKHVNSCFYELAKAQIEDTRLSIKEEFKDQYETLSPLGKYEVNEIIELVTESHPTEEIENLGIAVEAVINLQKRNTGQELMLKLSKLSDDDIDGLNHLLDNWNVKDALSVLSEIDRRISAIEAISTLSSDNKIDELKVLHPLVTESRWLFGPEFDSPEYTSNRTLQTVMKKLFGQIANPSAFENEKKRPDLIVLNDWFIGITGTEMFNSETGLFDTRQMLIIELKRGGATLNRDNVTQATNYIQDFLGCKELSGNMSIRAYVVGETIADNITTNSKFGNNDQAHLTVTTYAQLVNTARRRLFGLRDKLNERYDGIPGVELAKIAIQQPLF